MECAPLTTCLDVVLRENYPLLTPLLRTGRGWLRFAMVLSSERLLSFVNNTRMILLKIQFCPSQTNSNQKNLKINNLFLSFLWSLQPIGVEIEGNLKLLELQLENVEGGKMEVIPLMIFVFRPWKRNFWNAGAWFWSPQLAGWQESLRSGSGNSPSGNIWHL